MGNWWTSLRHRRVSSSSGGGMQRSNDETTDEQFVLLEQEPRFEAGYLAPAHLGQTFCINSVEGPGQYVHIVLYSKTKGV